MKAYTTTGQDRLEAFMSEHNARLLWTVPGPKRTACVELSAWSINGRVFIGQTYENSGFDVYGTDNSSSISELHAFVRELIPA